MYENNTTPAEQGTAGQTEPTVEQVLAEDTLTIRHQQEIARLEDRLTYWIQRYDELKAMVDKVREGIEDVLSGDSNPEQTFEDFKYPFELLGVVSEHEVEFELTVTYRGTITLPRGTSLDDLDGDDFGITEPDHNQYPTNIWQQDFDLSER